MLKDPASIALAAFFSFLGISISIYQVNSQQQEIPQQSTRRAVAEACTHTHTRHTLAPHSASPQILCHLRNYTEPVFQVSSVAVSLQEAEQHKALQQRLC